MNPVAWIGPNGEVLPTQVFEAWARLHPQKAIKFEPLYKSAHVKLDGQQKEALAMVLRHYSPDPRVVCLHPLLNG